MVDDWEEEDIHMDWNVVGDERIDNVMDRMIGIIKMVSWSWVLVIMEVSVVVMDSSSSSWRKEEDDS